MYYSLTWLGVALLVLGVLVFVGPAVWVIVRARRDRAVIREHRSSRRRRLGLDHERS